MSQPWKTPKWFVSPWNYLPEVAKEYAFAPQIKIHDMTLRDGEQQAGLELRKDDKIRIVDKSLGEADAAHHAFGELADEPGARMPQSDHVEQLLDAFPQGVGRKVEQPAVKQQCFIACKIGVKV